MTVSTFYEERLMDVRETVSGRCNPGKVQELMHSIHMDRDVEDLCQEEHDRLIVVLEDALASCCG